jgi:hypothetical protein
MATHLSLLDIAAMSETAHEMLAIEPEIKRLGERLDRLLRSSHGSDCSCPVCLAVGVNQIPKYIEDLTCLRWIIRRRTPISGIFLLSDAEARKRWEERRAEKAVEGGDGHPSPSPASRVDQPASPDVPAIEVGAEAVSPRRKKVA